MSQRYFSFAKFQNFVYLFAYFGKFLCITDDKLPIVSIYFFKNINCDIIIEVLNLQYRDNELPILTDNISQSEVISYHGIEE